MTTYLELSVVCGYNVCMAKGANMKNIHSKATFKSDIRYARLVLRQIEQAIASGDWSDVSDAANELAGTMATMSSLANDNHEGIEDFDCKWSGQIAEIRAARSAS